MFPQPQDVTSQGVNLRSERVIQVDILDLSEKPGADITIDCVLSMPFMAHFDRRFLFLSD
jgi:hypothetical protein